jgi:hypothetical protein
MTTTTIALLTEYLPRYGWPGFTVVEDTPAGGKIFTGWVSPVGGVRPMFIVLDHRTETLLLVCPALAAAPQDAMPVGQLADTLTALGFANYALQLGRFCYDPRDGEIRFEYGMPVGGAQLSYEQFAFMMNAAQGAVTYWAPRIKDAALGERSGASIVDSFLGHAAQFAPQS